MVENDKTYIVAAALANEKFSYGDVITKQWLQTALKIQYPDYGKREVFNKLDLQFMADFECLREIMLTEHCKALESVRGIGYRVVNPSQQTLLAMDNLKKGIKREVGKAINLLTHINETMLSHNQIRERDTAQGKIAALSAFSKKTKIAQS